MTEDGGGERKLSYSLLGLGVQLTDCYLIPPLGLQDINHIVPGRVKRVGGGKRTNLEQINIGVQDPKNGLAVRFGKIEPFHGKRKEKRSLRTIQK